MDAYEDVDLNELAETLQHHRDPEVRLFALGVLAMLSEFEDIEAGEDDQTDAELTTH